MDFAQNSLTSATLQHLIMTMISSITETGLNDTFNDNILNLHGYTIYRKDRCEDTSSSERFGGVLVAVKNKFTSIRLSCLPNIEQLFVLVKCSSFKFIIGTVYIPPRSPKCSYEIFYQSIESINEEYPNVPFYLVGDFNLPNIEWLEKKLSSVSLAKSTALPYEVNASDIMNECCSEFNLFQNNFIPNYRGVTLDLLLSSSKTSVVEADPIVPLDRNHPAFDFVISQKSIDSSFLKPQVDYFFDFTNGDYDSLSSFLSEIDWQNLLSNSDTPDMVNTFYKIVYEGIEKYVPKRRFRDISTFPLWYSSELKKCIFNKKIAHKAFKKNPNIYNHLKFKYLRKKCKELEKADYCKFINEIETGITSDPKNFWKYVNSQQKTNELPSSMIYDGLHLDDG